MKRFFCIGLIAVSLLTPQQLAAKEQASAQQVLSEPARQLQAQYEQEIKSLSQEIANSLPDLDQALYTKAREAEKNVEQRLKSTQRKLDEITKAKALVKHAKGKWIGGADKGIAAAQKKLKHAAKEINRLEAQKELQKWQKNRQDGVNALKERQRVFNLLQPQESRLRRDLERGKAEQKQSRTKTLQIIESYDLKSLLASDKLDARLLRCVVLREATPRVLAQFAAKSKGQELLVKALLADEVLMRQMLKADGARGGRYGAAMKIYCDIQQVSSKSSDGVLQRLALAVSLEHALPHKQRNAKGRPDAPSIVNPLKRYLHFEKAFLAGELDPDFKNLSTWDLRMVVNGEEPDEILAWGRDMLRNYRPDHIATADERWRYVALVRTDIKYGSQDNKYDKPELQFFQNILMNGGICGRRAFFGRFILRAFGVPTTARPQRGHASLAHRTSAGWVICLGGGWGAGWVLGRKSDLDFLEITQARRKEVDFLQVKRARWIGQCLEEKSVFGLRSGNPQLWTGIALYRQLSIVEEAKNKTLPAVGEELAEANESKKKYAIESAIPNEEDRRVSFAKDGLITIPAVACSKPTRSSNKIIFMRNAMGGKQLHYSRNGRAQDFEYTLDLAKAGKYALRALVVTPSWKQSLSLSLNGSDKKVQLPLPFSVGKWMETAALEIYLPKGRNVLRFSRSASVKGLTIKEFTLKPMN